ncbi:hypothetical protein DD630_04640, partial [Streptomyces sp. BSE7F]
MRGGTASWRTSGEAARVPVGDRAGEAEQLLVQDPLGRDDLGQCRQRSGVVGLGAALDQEPVDQAAALAPSVPHAVPAGAEAHPHPHSRLGVGVQLLGDGVVEVAVEVEDALVDEDAGDGQLLG